MGGGKTVGCPYPSNIMCGIIAYIGNREAAPILMEGLMRLEYRGYDSAGVAVVNGTGVVCYKSKGKVATLKEKLLGKELKGMAGLAHTRWATHGEPSEANAHPHADCKEKFFIVHNGIIENFMELKNKLTKEGHEFKSETDTEVLAHLIEKYYQGDLKNAVQKALQDVDGAYGIAVLSGDHPNSLVAARLGSPLVVGIADNEFVVASDLNAVLPITQRVIYLEDGEMAVFENGKYSITDFTNADKNKSPQTIEWKMEHSDRGEYSHFMLKEIFEQPDAIMNSTRGRLIPDEGMVKLGGLEPVANKLAKIERIVIVGMGTARHAGMVGEYMLEEYAHIPVEVDFSSEFTYRNALISPSTAIIAVSQSGETADTHLAVREAERKGALTLGIVNVPGSTIARETEAGVYNHIGPEISVASTKAFISQVTIFAMLSVHFGRMRGMSMVMGQRITKAIKELPDLAKKVLEQNEEIKNIAEKYKDSKSIFYLGRKYNFPVALEGALKLKEIAYVHAEGYNGGEMKHGPIALVDKGFPIIIIAPSDSVYEKNVSHIQELKVRGGKIIAIATEGNNEIKSLADDCLYIPKTLEMLTPILSVIPLQLMAFYAALSRGYDIDKPRNLAKSVTVE